MVSFGCAVFLCEAEVFVSDSKKLYCAILSSINDKMIKIYCIADHGIREAVYGGNMRDMNLILENIIYMELLRRGWKVTVGKTGNREIDFVCEKRGQKLYIQAAYLLADEWN